MNNAQAIEVFVLQCVIGTYASAFRSKILVTSNRSKNLIDGHLPREVSNLIDGITPQKGGSLFVGQVVSGISLDDLEFLNAGVVGLFHGS